MKYKKYSAARESNPAFDLNQIGKMAFHRAKTGDRLQRLEIITALLMCSLSMEAALNYLGNQLFVDSIEIERCLDEGLAKKLRKRKIKYTNWKAIERNLSPKQKLDIIAKYSNIEIDMDLYPFQSFSKIFSFRNNLVHAKTSKHFISKIQPDAIDENGFPIINEISELSTDWEKLYNIKTVEEWRKAVYSMSSELSKASKCQDPIIIGGKVDIWGEIDI